MHRCAREAFQVRRCRPSGGWGQLLSTRLKEPTECCVHVSQHGYCLVDTISDWSVQTYVRTVHSETTFLSSIRSLMSKFCDHAEWNKQRQTSPLDRLSVWTHTLFPFKQLTLDLCIYSIHMIDVQNKYCMTWNVHYKRHKEEVESYFLVELLWDLYKQQHIAKYIRHKLGLFTSWSINWLSITTIV